jgi:hypothetical protein
VTKKTKVHHIDGRSFHGKNFVISSPGKGVSYQSCREVVRKVISAQDVHVPSEILSRNVAAFSYFYDRALDNGILLPGQVEVSYNSFTA